MKTRNIILATALTGLFLNDLSLDSKAQTHVTSDKTTVTDHKLTVSEVKPMQFRVNYTPVKTNTVVIRILDSEKTILFSERQSAEGNYQKYFDLSPLLDGTYTFEVIDGKDRFVQSFDILTKTQRVVSSLN